jgi:hypothetical protein
MLLGHIGLGLAGKSASRKMPIWTALIAVMLPDIVSALFQILRVPDESMFWSHSLLMTLVYAIVSAVVIYIIYKNIFDTLLFAALVLSHWVCDFISWPLEVIGMSNGIQFFSPTETFGLGLYRKIPGALISELLLLAFGIGLLVLRNRKGRS